MYTKPLGTIRTCSRCQGDYEHYGQGIRLCRPCIKIYHCECKAKQRQNPEWRANKRALARARYERNKFIVSSHLKQCRCKECREHDPRTLRFYDEKGRIWFVNKIIKQTVNPDIVRKYLKTCQVMCFNCRAKAGLQITESVMAA